MITTHTLAACSPGFERPFLELQPLGDYPEVPAIRLSTVGGDSVLEIPDGTRAFEARLGTDAGRDASYLGYAERSAANDVPILLWPPGAACRLSTLDESEYPFGLGGQGLGYAQASRTLLVAGAAAVASAAVGALAFDAGTGADRTFMSRTPGERMAEPRAHATVTPFGDRLLVAGGEDPLKGDMMEMLVVSQTAEIFDPQVQAFTSELVPLAVSRTRHSAVPLANGDTLLVGGRNQFGAALHVLEIVSPRDERSNIAGLASLRVPRLAPAVLRLEDGQLFIGGGTAADRTPISALEWLSADAAEHIAIEIPQGLPQRHDRAFAAMPGGGVLMVGGCASAPIETGSDGPACAVCRTGCPPLGESPTEPEYDAWWVTPDRVVTRISLPIPAPQPVLLGGADGAPWLAAGDPSNRDRLFRFDPWKAAFEVEDALAIAHPPTPAMPVVALDGQAFAWLSPVDEARPALFGFRAGTSNRYAHTEARAADAALAWVPDRPPGEPASVRYDGETLAFESESPVRVYASGVDFADFEMSFVLAEDSAAPRLVFTSEDRVGAALIDVPPSAERQVSVTRRGRNLRLSAGSSHVSAAITPGRVRVGFAVGTGKTTLGAIALRRMR